MLSLISLDESLENQQVLSIFRTFDFFFVTFAYFYFLKQSLHRHNYISIIFIFLGISLILCTIDWNKLNLTYEIFFALFASVLFTILEITEKWMIDTSFYSLHEILFFVGLFTTIIMLTICTISSYVPCENWMKVCKTGANVINLSDEISIIMSNTFYIIQVILYILLPTGYNEFIQLVLKYYGPTHRVITDVFSSLCIILFMLSRNSPLDTVLQSVGEIVIIIGVLIYNEIVLVHLCGMDENTEVKIRERASSKDDIVVLFKPIINPDEIEIEM